jgi:hypothetical protein
MGAVHGRWKGAVIITAMLVEADPCTIVMLCVSVGVIKLFVSTSPSIGFGPVQKRFLCFEHSQ